LLPIIRLSEQESRRRLTADAVRFAAASACHAAGHSAGGLSDQSLCRSTHLNQKNPMRVKAFIF
jgi:hypothetical protein